MVPQDIEAQASTSECSAEAHGIARMLFNACSFQMSELKHTSTRQENPKMEPPNKP